jgi:hypothetical protein
VINNYLPDSLLKILFGTRIYTDTSTGSVRVYTDFALIFYENFRAFRAIRVAKGTPMAKKIEIVG